MFPASTREHSQTIWTRCQFVRRQRKGAKPVRTKLNLACPRKHHFHSNFNTWRQNHNEVQSVAAVKWFRRELVAVNPLHTIVLGVAKTKQVYSAKWLLHWAESFNSNVSSSAFTCKTITTVTITSKIASVNRGVLNLEEFRTLNLEEFRTHAKFV
jgi:hypothetical protein